MRPPPFAVFQNAYKVIKEATQKGHSSVGRRWRVPISAFIVFGLARARGWEGYVIHCRLATRCTTVVPKLVSRKKGGICLCRRLPCRPTVFCLLTRSVGRFSVAQINARRNMNGSELIFLSGVPLGGPKNIPSLIDVFNLLVSPVDTSETDYGRSNARLCRFSPLS